MHHHERVTHELFAAPATTLSAAVSVAEARGSRATRRFAREFGGLRAGADRVPAITRSAFD